MAASTERDIERALAAQYGEKAVSRVFSLLDTKKLRGPALHAIPLSTAKNQLSQLVRNARGGKAQLIRQGHSKPVVMLSMVDLATLLCEASRSPAIGDLLRELGPGPVLEQPLLPPHRGGALRLPALGNPPK